MKRFCKSIILTYNAFSRCDKNFKTVFYHDIGKKYTSMGTPFELFCNHMNKLRVKDRVCFDDGFRGIWNVRAELKKRNIKPIIFIAIDLVGKPEYLSWDEILILQNEYEFDFQSHSYTHQTLAGPYNKKAPIPKNGRTDDWLLHELNDSKLEIENRLLKKVTSFCFPLGYFSDKIVEKCKEIGYECVYASFPGNITNDYIQSRCLCQNLSSFEFGLVLKGGMNSLKTRYMRMHKCN